MPSARSLLLAVAALLCLGAPAASAAPPVIGMADQKPDMFYDERFRSLGIVDVRYNLAWDAFQYPWQVQELDNWLSAARQAGARPLVTLSQSRVAGQTRTVPSTGQVAKTFRELRKRYPWVKNFAAWNEANYCGQPTCNKPWVVAGYYRAMKRTCPGCTVLAAELLDMPNMEKWVRGFVKADGGRQPPAWGLHNYVSVNRLQVGGTKRLLKATTGKIWLTETGGIVDRKIRKGSPAFEQSPRHAAKVTKFIFDKVVPLSPRITHVFLYMWNTGPKKTNWDSALVGHDGTPRPALAILEEQVKKGERGRKAGA